MYEVYAATLHCAEYNFEKLGKCNKKFITDHIQWDKNKWLNDIAYSSVGICPATHYGGAIRNFLADKITCRKKNYNDFLLRYKNTLNASRSFVFHQLKIPVVAEIASCHHHIMGDETAGLICYSENSWYESIKQLEMNEGKRIKISEKAYRIFYELYSPEIWCERFVEQLKEWVIDS